MLEQLSFSKHLSVFSKLFESIMAEQLTAYFENISSHLLSAYRKPRVTVVSM